MADEELLIPPAWDVIEADPEYQALSPEDQAQTLSNWAKSTRKYGEQQGWWDDPDTQKQFTESSRAKLQEIQSKLPPITGASAGVYGDNPIMQTVGTAVDRANLGVQEFAPRAKGAADQLLSLATRVPELVTSPIDAVAGTDLTKRYQQFNKIGQELNRWAMFETEKAQEIAEAGRALGGGTEIPYLGRPGDLLQEAIPTTLQAFMDIGLSGGAGGARSLQAPAKTAMESIIRATAEPAVKRAAYVAGGEQALATLNQEIQERVANGESTEEAQARSLPKAIAAGLVTMMTTRFGGTTGAESVLKESGVTGLKNRIIEVLKEGGYEGAEESIDQYGNQIAGWMVDELDPTKPKSGTWYDRLAKAVNIPELVKSGFLGGIIGSSITAVGQASEAARERAIASQAANVRQMALEEAEREIIENADRVASETEKYAPATAQALRVKARQNAEEAKKKINEAFDAQEKKEEEEMKSRVDKLLSTSQEELSKPTPEQEMEESAPEVEGDERFAPPAETSAVSSEAGEQTLSGQSPQTITGSNVETATEMPVQDEAQAVPGGIVLETLGEQDLARARVEEALATGQTPDPADIELAGAVITPAQPQTQDAQQIPITEAPDGSVQQPEGAQENVQVPSPEGGEGIPQGRQEEVKFPEKVNQVGMIPTKEESERGDAIIAFVTPILESSDEKTLQKFASELGIKTTGLTTEAQIRRKILDNSHPDDLLSAVFPESNATTTVSQPSLPEGEAGTPESPEGQQVAPRRVQLRVSPQVFEVIRELPQTEIEKANGERFFEVRNERTGETQLVESRDILREVKPKSERVKKAIAKLPKNQQAKAEAATTEDNTPDPYQGAPLSRSAPLELDENLRLLDDLSRSGVLDEGANARTVLEKIRDNKKTPDWQKRLAQRLLEAGMRDLAVRAVYRPSSTWAALFTGPEILFNLARKSPGVTETVLHESAHKLTLAQLRNPGNLKGEAAKAYKELQDIFNKIKDRPEFRGQYGISNVEEMVAEAFSNAGFRAKLDRIQDGPKTLWERFVNAITRLLFNKTAAYDSLLHRTIENAFTLGGAPIIEASSRPAPMAGGVTPEQDAAYMDAVNRGDMETAQRMVDEAARNAGYDSAKVFHGTGARFDRFSFDYAGKVTEAESAKIAFFFTDGRRTAESYARKAATFSEDQEIASLLKQMEQAEKVGDWDKAEALMARMEELEFGEGADERRKALEEESAQIYEVYLKGNFKTLDAEGNNYRTLSNASDFKQYGGNLTKALEQAKIEGFEGVKIENFDDAINETETATHWAVFSPNQIKSADPVTYINGEVVPLSQRFNPQSDLIAAMAEPDNWEDVVGNPNASNEAEARAYAQMEEELSAETEITEEDIKPLTPEQASLIAPREGFNPIAIVNFWAKQFRNIPNTTHEDRVGEAKLGLVKAAQTYDQSKGIPFFQWASNIIRNHMVNARKKQLIRQKYITEDRPVLEEDDTETLTTTLPSPEDLTIQENDKNRMIKLAGEALQAVMDRASERDKSILSAYANGESLRQVGLNHNMSPEGVRKVLKRFREQVENALFLRGVTDIREILEQPTETYGTAEPTRPSTIEDEESFNPNQVGTLESDEIERQSPLPDEALQDSEEVFAANADDGGTLAQDDAIRSEGDWVQADLGGTDAKDADLQIFHDRATAKNLGPDDARRARRVLGNVLIENVTNEIEGIFGKRVVFVSGLPEGAPSGLYIKSNPNAIYLNIEGKYPLMFLTGHEFGHSLKKTNPELYKELQDYVLSNASDWTDYKNNLIKNKGYTESQVADEFTEDFIGNNFNDQGFWYRLWQNDKPLFEKLAEAAILYLRKLLGRVSSMSRDVRPYFENWQQAQDKLIDIVQRAKANVPMVAPMAERAPSQEAVSEITKAVNSARRTYVPPAVRPGEAYEVDPNAQSVWAAVLDKGHLPASLKDVYDRLSNRINGVRGMVKVYTDDVKRAVEKLHKTKEDRDAEYGRIQNALTQQGDMTISKLDETLQGPVWKIRNTIDTLSQAAIDYGIVEGDLADTFRDGIGNYLRRGYAVFDPESGWNYKFLKKKKPEILSAARAYLKRKNPEATEDQIEATIKDLLDRDTAAGFMLGGKKVLGKSIGSLMERKDIAKPIRDLLGEIKDPLVNLVRSGDFLGQLIAREEMQQEFRKVALKQGLVSVEQNSTMTTPLVEDTWIRTVDDDGNPIFRIRSNRRYDVLRGLYTTPEFRKAFELAEKFGDAGAVKKISDFFIGGFLTASATAKTFATVLNPDSYAPNYLGALLVEIGNGRWKPSTWKDAWAAMRSAKNPNTVISAAKNAGIKDARTLYNELVRGGVFDQNITFRDFEATLKNSWLGKLSSQRKAPLETIGALYSTGDNLGKANAFVDEITTLKKAYPDMPYRELVDKAVQIVIDTTPTYSTVPKAFRDLSQFGFFLQNFFNFTYSINRVAFYTAKQGISELRSDNTVLKLRGARRLSGLAMVLAGASYWGASLLSRWMTDFDEDKDMAFRRSFAAPWDRDANLIYTNIEDGKVTYANTTYLNPFALVAETLTAVIQGESPADAAEGVLRTVMGNFFSEGIFLSAVLDVARNRKKGTSQEVYNEELDGWAKAVAAGDYVIAKSLTPKIITKAIRTYKGITGEVGDYGRTYSAYDEALRLVGYRANTIDLRKNLTNRLYDLNSRYRNAEKIERVAINKGRTGTSLEKSQQQSAAAKQRVLDDYQILLKDAQTLGITEKEFKSALKETKTQVEVREFLFPRQ